MRHRIILVGLLALATAARGEDAAGLQAEQITSETAAALQIGGPDATGGVGDWYLANDLIEVIVDDPSRRFGTLNHGGTLIDAGLRDRRGEDQFARLFPIVNLDQRVFLGYDAIRAEVDEEKEWARLVVSNSGRMDSVARSDGFRRWFDPLVPEPERLRHVAVETEYRVARGQPFVSIRTTFHNAGPSPAPIQSYGDVWMRGGRSTRAFVGNTLDPSRSRGFHHLNFNRHNVLAAGDAMAAFTFVSVPGMPAYPPIAYALFAPERSARGLRQFGVTGTHVTLATGFVGDPDWDAMSLWRLARATRGELPAGESWTFERRLLITGHADTASTTDVIFPATGFADGRSGLVGTVETADLAPARVVVHVDDADSGAPITQIATAAPGAAAGNFRAVLPPGRYDLLLRSAQRGDVRRAVEVSDGEFARVPSVVFDEPGWLVFAPAFADRGAGRVVVRGVGDTPDPVFQPELLDFRIDGAAAKSGSATSDLIFTGGDGDPSRVAVPPGRYRLVATRGPEWDIGQVSLDVTGPGVAVPVAPFALQHQIELPGYVSADLHVHSEASDDSGMTNAARLRGFVAESVDVLVTTEHENLGWFDPVLDATGLRGRIHVIQGAEVTSSAPSPTAPYTIGHHNAWPIALQPRSHRRGAPASQDRSVADLYAALRRDHGARVVQLNHPRDGGGDGVEEGAYFSHLATAGRGFDPALPIGAEPNRLLLAPGADGTTRPIDFDAIEVMNGRSFGEYRKVRRDWYSLLRQGYARTGTANSDTHGPDRPAGFPRNYVRVDGAWDPSHFDAALRHGRSFGTNGPLLPVFIANGGAAGDIVPAPGGQVAVELVVAAVSWVPVDEVRLLVDGEVVRVYRDGDLAAGEIVRLEDQLALRLERDAFVTLEAGAPLDLDSQAWERERGGVYARDIAPGFVPTAFSNPIYLDVDGNGRFDPPGLPEQPASRLSPSLVAAGFLLLLSLWWRRRFSRARTAG